MSIEGKVALVTGGSGGLGRVHGLVLARLGVAEALTGHRHLEKAEAVAEEIKSEGGKAMGIKIDVSNPDEVNEGVVLVEKELGPIDILVNNAAFGSVPAVTIAKMPKEDWDKDVSGKT